MESILLDVTRISETQRLWRDDCIETVFRNMGGLSFSFAFQINANLTELFADSLLLIIAFYSLYFFSHQQILMFPKKKKKSSHLEYLQNHVNRIPPPPNVKTKEVQTTYLS